MTRRFSRIRSNAVLVLAVTAVAAPAAVADTPVGADQLSIDAPASGRLVVGDSVRDRFRPATARQMAGDPVGDRFSPAARVDGRRETPPAVVSAPPLAQANQFDWLDAGIGAGGLAVLLLVGTGTAKTVRTRRAPVRAS